MKTKLNVQFLYTLLLALLCTTSYGASSFNQDIDNWDVGEVTDMVFMGYSIDPPLDLRNGDVLRCLVQVAEYNGWRLMSIYEGPYGKRIVVFTKRGHFKNYIGKN